MLELGNERLPSEEFFRTFIQADQPQSAIIAINHKGAEIRLNDSVVFQQDPLWSGDQQVNENTAFQELAVEVAP
ncbi:MAG: hypothetical protein RL693_2324 [Verrucomicrobiota bacterium]